MELNGWFGDAPLFRKPSNVPNSLSPRRDFFPWALPCHAMAQYGPWSCTPWGSTLQQRSLRGKQLASWGCRFKPSDVRTGEMRWSGVYPWRIRTSAILMVCHLPSTKTPVLSVYVNTYDNTNRFTIGFWTIQKGNGTLGGCTDFIYTIDGWMDGWIGR